jgi:glycosyltransferase involved in cell wall biosynthesis
VVSFITQSFLLDAIGNRFILIINFFGKISKRIVYGGLPVAAGKRACWKTIVAQAGKHVKTVGYMKIINSVLGDASGGRWQVVCDYSRALTGNGHSVLMLLNDRHLPELHRIPPGVDVELVKSRGHYDYAAAWLARRRLRQFAPDIALAHCSRSVALLKRALRRSTPVVAVTHSNKVKRMLPADAYFALTHHIRRKIEAKSKAGVSRPCFVIPNMISIDQPLRKAHRDPGRPVRIGALGRFDPVKGFDVFLAALAVIESRSIAFRAVLGGRGKEGARLRMQARQLGLGEVIEFSGWVDRVDRFFAGIDILCVPARADAFGLTPLQGAAAGVPLVLSRASGHLEMFAEETQALFCEVADPDSTAAQLQRLITDPELAERLRRSAYDQVSSRYSVQAVTERILEAIEYIVKNHNIKCHM